MERKIRLDQLARYLDCYISTETCNLRCSYCYITQKRLFTNKLVKFKYSPEEIARALSKKRLGGTCLLNFCAGGETLLAEDVIPVIKALLEEGHYIMVVTNGTLTKRFEEIACFPTEWKERLIFKFSFHYLELKRLGWLKRFYKNVNLMKKSGCSYTVELTPSDELLPYREELRKACIKQFGALCHVTIARDDREYQISHLSEMDFETYKEVWGAFDSELFSYKSELFYQHRKEFCYAGEYTCVLNLSNGSLSQCYFGKVICNIYENVEEEIPFRAIGHGCRCYHCYNGHAFLSLGAIPKLEAPSYAQLRNKKMVTGKEWLYPRMKEFLDQRVSDNQPRYTGWQKLKADWKSREFILKTMIERIQYNRKRK